MKRRAWLAGGVAVAAGAAGVAFALRPKSTPASASTEALWRLKFDMPGGGELALRSLKGRPLLINFWATWCPPCVREMPMLDAFQQRTAGMAVVGLAVDGPTPVREYLGRVPVGFPIGLAGLDGADLARSLGNETGGLPFTAVFDRRGSFHARKLGSLALVDLDRWAKELSTA